MTENGLWIMLFISSTLLLIWIFMIEIRKTILGINTNNMEWYHQLVNDIPVLVATILIISITGFTIYAYFCRDMILAEKFFETMDAFATGVWGFLIGYGSGKTLSKREMGESNAIEIAESSTRQSLELEENTKLKAEKEELLQKIEDMTNVINSYTRNNTSGVDNGVNRDEVER
jgi:patatin-like phospholipase/acyl hydrolase